VNMAEEKVKNNSSISKQKSPRGCTDQKLLERYEKRSENCGERDHRGARAPATFMDLRVGERRRVNRKRLCYKKKEERDSSAQSYTTSRLTVMNRESNVKGGKNVKKMTVEGVI